MNDRDDSAWVFDSLIGFLQGPIWSTPLITFVEEKSLSKFASLRNSTLYALRNTNQACVEKNIISGPQSVILANKCNIKY